MYLTSYHPSWYRNKHLQVLDGAHTTINSKGDFSLTHMLVHVHSSDSLQWPSMKLPVTDDNNVLLSMEV